MAQAREDEQGCGNFVWRVQVPQEVKHGDGACHAVIDVSDRGEGHEGGVWRQ